MKIFGYFTVNGKLASKKVAIINRIEEVIDLTTDEEPCVWFLPEKGIEVTLRDVAMMVDPEGFRNDDWFFIPDDPEDEEPTDADVAEFYVEQMEWELYYLAEDAAEEADWGLLPEELEFPVKSRKARKGVGVPAYHYRHDGKRSAGNKYRRRRSKALWKHETRRAFRHEGKAICRNADQDNIPKWWNDLVIIPERLTDEELWDEKFWEKGLRYVEEHTDWIDQWFYNEDPAPEFDEDEIAHIRKLAKE